MSPDRISPITATRLASLPRVTALILAGLLLCLIALGLAGAPTGQPAGNPASGDAALYRQIAARVAAGEPYYHAAAAEHRPSAYPLKPFTAVRQPLLAEIGARLGPSGADWLLRVLAVAAALTTAWRIAPQLPPPCREAALLLSATAGTAFVQKGMWVWHDIWAGLLVMLALACRTERHWAGSLLLGVIAAAVRELAFPFLLIMSAAAWMEGARREALGWLAGAAVFVALLALHKANVDLVLQPGDGTSPGWLALGGWHFDLALARQSALFGFLPIWAVAVAVPLALLGWCAWPGGYAIRAAALLILWLSAFLVVGRPDNAYWGFLFAPLLPVGLAIAPLALRDLCRAGLRPRRFPAKPDGALGGPLCRSCQTAGSGSRPRITG